MGRRFLLRREWVRCALALTFFACGGITRGKDPDDLEAQIVLELPLEERSVLSPTEIIKICSKALTQPQKMKPEELAHLYSHRAAAFVALEDFAKSKSDLDDAIKLAPGDLQLRCHRATALLGLGLPSDALDELKNVLFKDPKFPAAYSRQAYVFFSIGDLKKCIKSATKAIELDGSNPYPLEIRGQALMMQGDYKTALQDLNRCIELSPFRSKGHPYLLRGKLFLELRRTREALDNFLLAKQLDPSSALALYGLYSVYHAQQRYALCYHLTQELVRKVPKSPKAHIANAITCNKLGRYEDALNSLTQALKLDANNVDAHVELGNTYEYKEDYASALKQYDQALAIDCNDVNALKSKALLLAASPDAKYRDGKLARDLAKRSCVLTDRKQPECMLALAIAHAECGEFDKASALAKKCCDMVAESDPYSLSYCKECWRLFQNHQCYRLIQDHPMP